jgi:hypothetical protein
MVSRSHIVARTATFSVLLVYFVLTGCQSSPKNLAPTIAFSKVPAAYQENPYKIHIFQGRDYKTDMVEGRATPSPKVLNFSGYEWTTSTGSIFRAGSRNFFDPANVWTDERDAMHLRISGRIGCNFSRCS